MKRPHFLDHCSTAQLLQHFVALATLFTPIALLATGAQAKLVQSISNVRLKVANAYDKVIEQDQAVTLLYDDATPQPTPMALIHHGRAPHPEKRAAFSHSTAITNTNARWFGALGANGGIGEFVLYPPNGNDGHGLFSQAPAVWRPKALECPRANRYSKLKSIEEEKK